MKFDTGLFITRHLAGKPDQSMYSQPLTSSDITKLSEAAADAFQREYVELFSAFDVEQLGQTLATYLQVKGFSDLEKLNQAAASGDCAEFSSLMIGEIGKAFYNLLRNPNSILKKIQLVPDFPAEARVDLSRLSRSVEATQRPEPEPVAAPVAPAPPIDPIDQVVDDWKNLGSAAFKTKYMSNQRNRPLYDRAVREGRL